MADLVHDEPSMSRLHTGLLAPDDSLTVSDLGSRNGTLLNGALVTGPRPIAPGDVLTLGKVTLVLQGQRAAGEDRFVALPQLRERLVDELARATHYDRPLALVALSAPSPWTPQQFAAVKPLLRSHDPAALDGPHVLVGVLPEMDEGESGELARELLTVLGVA